MSEVAFKEAKKRAALNFNSKLLAEERESDTEVVVMNLETAVALKTLASQALMMTTTPSRLQKPMCECVVASYHTGAKSFLLLEEEWIE